MYVVYERAEFKSNMRRRAPRQSKILDHNSPKATRDDDTDFPSH